MGRLYFAVVNGADTLIFEGNLFPPSSKAQTEDNEPYLLQFVAHASLDVVDEVMWNSTNMYLKTIDKFNDLLVSAFVTPGNTRLLLLYDTPRADESIRAFMGEAFEAYCKALLNPLYKAGTKIESRQFQSKVRQLAIKYFV